MLVASTWKSDCCFAYSAFPSFDARRSRTSTSSGSPQYALSALRSALRRGDEMSVYFVSSALTLHGVGNTCFPSWGEREKPCPRSSFRERAREATRDAGLCGSTAELSAVLYERLGGRDTSMCFVEPPSVGERS